MSDDVEQKTHIVYDQHRNVGYTTKGLRGHYIHIDGHFFGEFENFEYFNTLYATKYTFVEVIPTKDVIKVQPLCDGLVGDEDEKYDYDFFQGFLTPP